MYCSSCGKKIGENDLFCTNCGKKKQAYESHVADEEKTKELSVDEIKYINGFSVGYFALTGVLLTSILFPIFMRFKLIDWVKYWLVPMLICIGSVVAIWIIGGLLSISINPNDPMVTVLLTILTMVIIYFYSTSVRRTAFLRRRWRSFDDFKRCQQIWDSWGWFVVVIIVIASIGRLSN